MKPAGLKTTVPTSSTDHRCGIGVWVVEANHDQVYWALNAFGLHRKKEETLALISEENVRTNRAKPWISNRQIYVGFGTALTWILGSESADVVHGLKPNGGLTAETPWPVDL